MKVDKRRKYARSDEICKKCNLGFFFYDQYIAHMKEHEKESK